MIAVLAGLADAERDLIRTRTAEGRRSKKRPEDGARRALRCKNWRAATLSGYPLSAA